MCFALLNRALHIALYLTVFRHFYVTMARGDWVSISLHSNGINICYGLPTSIKKWKTEFFFVEASFFSVTMQFGSLLNRLHDPNPELTIDEQLTVDRLVANYVKWSDPDDSLLKLANLEGNPYMIDRPSTPALRGQNNSLLERVHRNRNAPNPKVAEGTTTISVTPVEGEMGLDSKSSIDSRMQPESDDPTMISSSPPINKRKETINRRVSLLFSLRLSQPGR
ncbi:unnamed protein product [Lactuca virosa]|uniref:Uncharacterized protein n=1 Tax=Lactuca virosa TaxID=75947 RepID=A0AAU9LCS4_9ASTR|nr:unnamed protein product [Lactuca virosa]